MAIPLRTTLTLLLLTSCSDPQPSSEVSGEVDSTQHTSMLPSEQSPSREVSSVNRSSRYTSLAGCPVVETDPEPTGFQVSECVGIDGFRLRLIDADARHDLAVIDPAGRETTLALPTMFGGAFSTLGERVEWRGTTDEDRFTPDAMIIRYAVFENPDRPNQPVSYLLAVSLADTPCVSGSFTPGEQQNLIARAAADRGVDQRESGELGCADDIEVWKPDFIELPPNVRNSVGLTKVPGMSGPMNGPARKSC